MKKILALLLAAVLVLGMAACAASPAAPAQTTSDTASDASDTPASNAETPAASAGAKLRFVPGGESGTYYAFGSVIAQHATNNAGVDIVGLVGNGSQSNIFELEDGNAELAFCQSDVMAYAYDGTNLFADTGAVSCFSTVAALFFFFYCLLLILLGQLDAGIELTMAHFLLNFLGVEACTFTVQMVGIVE